MAAAGDEARALIESVFGGFDEDKTIADVVQEESRRSRSEAGKKRWAGRKGFTPGVDDDEDYDPDAIYTRATNIHNHSQTMKVNIPLDLSAVVAQIVSSDDTPYSSPADLMRDALVHRLMHWERRLGDDGLAGPVHAQVLRAKIETRAILRQAGDELAELMVVEMREASTRGDVAGVEEMVAMCREQIAGGRVLGGALEKMLELVEKYG